MKNFLESNKIYFEIFSMSFLGLMAVIVSFTQWRTSNQEFELHRNENMPLFKISYELIKADTTDKYDTEILKVSNEGKLVKRFSKEFFSFYLFTIKTHEYPVHEMEVYVPVADFFGVSYNSDNLSGNLFESYSYGNLSNLINTENYCHTLSMKKNMWVAPARKVYFKFDFTDISNEKHTVYMDTYGNDISEDDYNEMKKRVDRFSLGMMVMERITNEFIDKIITAKN